MQFLLQTIAFNDDKPVYYTIYLTGPDRYFAENINEAGKMEFYFGLVNGEWTAG